MLAILVRVGWGWGKIEIKDQLSPAEAEVRAELGKLIFVIKFTER